MLAKSSKALKKKANTQAMSSAASARLFEEAEEVAKAELAKRASGWSIRGADPEVDQWCDVLGIFWHVFGLQRMVTRMFWSGPVLRTLLVPGILIFLFLLGRRKKRCFTRKWLMSSRRSGLSSTCSWSGNAVNVTFFPGLFVHCGLEGLKRADLYSLYHHFHLNWGQVCTINTGKSKHT